MAVDDDVDRFSNLFRVPRSLPWTLGPLQIYISYQVWLVPALKYVFCTTSRFVVNACPPPPTYKFFVVPLRLPQVSFVVNTTTSPRASFFVVPTTITTQVSCSQRHYHHEIFCSRHYNFQHYDFTTFFVVSLRFYYKIFCSHYDHYCIQHYNFTTSFFVVSLRFYYKIFCSHYDHYKFLVFNTTTSPRVFL